MATVEEMHAEMKSAFEGFSKDLEKLATHVEQQDVQIKSIGGTKPETSKAIEKFETTLQQSAEDYKSLQKQLDEIQTKIQRLPQSGRGGSSIQFKTVGRRVETSEELKKYQSDNCNGNSPIIQVKSFFEGPEFKTDYGIIGGEAGAM